MERTREPRPNGIRRHPLGYSSLGRTHLGEHSGRRGRTLDAFLTVGTLDVCQNPNRHERPIQHAIRHGLGGMNPIRLVRQSAKRKKIPLVLTPDEIHRLIAALPLKESMLVFLGAGTGLRMSVCRFADNQTDRDPRRS